MTAQRLSELNEALINYRRQRALIQTQLNSVRRDMTGERRSFKKTFTDLERFFPNEKFHTLEEIESFHQKLTKILTQEFTETERSLATTYVLLGVKAEDIQDHEMHSEFCMISQETADIINETKAAGGRVICVGTTSCRTIESFAAKDGTMTERSGWTNIFIYPGYRFKVLDALITNFHLPQSTLIMLVSALAGREHVLAAYEEAVRERYRFFSFGDAMFIY